MTLTLPTDPKRIESIDLLRGLVMIIMALDHTRDFFHETAFTQDPLDVSTTTPFLYFTRWITHLCASTFVFLSGVSVWLQSQRKTKKDLSRFLITRGLWFILLEITVVTLGITGDIYYGFIVLQTIWSIGISMVILGLVIWLPFNVILMLGLAIVLGHNALNLLEINRNGGFPVWWHLLHVPGFLPIDKNHTLAVLYPFLPWTGVMLLGYCCGKIFTAFDPPKRSKILFWLGIGILVFFVALRATNLYGDSILWSRQKDWISTFLSFMNLQKYPPSLLFICATVAPGLIFLALEKKTQSRLAKIIIVYGRVPFFYYILHFYLIHFLCSIAYLSRGHSLEEGMKGIPGLPFKFIAIGEGYSLGIVYLIWIGVVMALYPLCKWYDTYKTKHKEKWWLSYL